VLPDLLGPGLDVVFCGSAAGSVSAQRGAYYAGPGNRFWPTLFKTGLTPRPLRPEEFRAALGFGIGLTDLAKFASGADGDLGRAADDPEALRRKIEAARPQALAFVGRRAARVVLGRAVEPGRQKERIGGAAVFVLPSPSGAARGYWDTGPWRALADFLGRAPLQKP
jgi:double-stranded uracil-DNA glycosylase